MSHQHTNTPNAKADAALDDYPPVGARVRVGSGKTVWTVAEYWPAPRGDLLATLRPVDGYSGTTVDADRLRSADQ